MPETLSAAQKKQSRILNVATSLFLERGYDAVSLDDIVERVGGSKTTLYSYYGGKEGLFSAIVHKSCHDRLAPLLQMDVVDLEPQEGLSLIGRSFLSLISHPEGKALYRIMIAEADRFPKLAADFYAAGPEVATKLIQRNLEHWQKKGRLRPGNTESFAVQFIGLLLGDFSARSMLGLSSALTEQEIKEWVSKGVTLFLEGALTRR